MTATFTTRAGDVLDEIANNYYGRTDGGLVEWLLEQNPDLADFGPIFPAGVVIQLPDPPAPEPNQFLQLFS